LALTGWGVNNSFSSKASSEAQSSSSLFLFPEEGLEQFKKIVAKHKKSDFVFPAGQMSRGQRKKSKEMASLFRPTNYRFKR
jgi:hypothetical protein